ncbi:hypothetical protein HK100_007497 [Physocladia obscura]|uniref:Pirin N-terminal domain-containing protein n=1 Tax=Physocladia obscura TaxID=109957 RepID=A0AAD5T6F3_9FUNG|nr:hypothetical protein HK100_007497 [Physocladia obscura]
MVFGLRRIVKHLQPRLLEEGFIRNHFHPHNEGNLLKPFIYLDQIKGNILPAGTPGAFRGFGLHPHSGMSTLTYNIRQKIEYVDSEGLTGSLEPHGVEFMRAGGGMWHASSFPKEGGAVLGFQFWLALPQENEDGPSMSHLIPPTRVPFVRDERNNISVRVLLGEFAGQQSPIVDPPTDKMSVLDASVSNLSDGTKKLFRRIFPDGHSTAWMLVYDGIARVNGNIVENDTVLVLGGEGDAVEVSAEGIEPAKFILASTVPYPYELIARNTSSHTNKESMEKGRSRIKEIGVKLKAEGKL